MQPRVLLKNVQINSTSTFSCACNNKEAVLAARCIAVTKRDASVEVRQHKGTIVLNIWGQDGEELEPTREFHHGKFVVVSEP